MDELTKEIFCQLCRQNVSIMDGWRPVSSRAVADLTEQPIGKVKYRLRKLKSAGLVNGVHKIYYRDDIADFFSEGGYCVSAAGMETEEFVRAAYEEQHLCERVFEMQGMERYAEICLHGRDEYGNPLVNPKIREIEKRLGFVE